MAQLDALACGRGEGLLDPGAAVALADPFDRSIDVQISRLRKKLEAAGFAADALKTVRGAGYVLALAVEDAP